MPSTFGQLADRLLQDLMHMAIRCRCLRVDFVCDQYPVQNIKNRERRAMSGTQAIHITRPDQKTPKEFTKYLAKGRNRELLIEFFFKCWTRCDTGILGNSLLVVSHGEVCHSRVLVVVYPLPGPLFVGGVRSSRFGPPASLSPHLAMVYRGVPSRCLSCLCL